MKKKKNTKVKKFKQKILRRTLILKEILMMIKKTRSNNLTVIMGIKHMINPLNLITTLMMTYMMTIDLLRSFINFF